jgi:TRAP-type C4-dicarboxylate transport system substrate-binding protein
MMNRVFSSLAHCRTAIKILSLLIIVTFCLNMGSTVQAAKKVPFKFGFVTSGKLVAGVWGYKIEQYLNESGKFDAKFFPNALLGTDPEMCDKIRMGLIQGGVQPMVTFGNTVPYTDVLVLPFVTNTWEKALLFLHSPVSEDFRKGVEPYGFKSFGFCTYGLFGMESTKKATTLAEYQKLKFRVSESPVMTKTFKALNITPMVIQFPDLYESLKQGVVDGCDLPPDVAVFVKFTEVIKYYAETGHSFGWYMLVTNKQWYDNLSEENQAIFSDVVDRASRETFIYSRHAELAALKKFDEIGVEVVNFPPEEIQKMVDATKPVIDWRLGEYDQKGREMAKKVMDVVGYEYDWSKWGL